MALLSVLLLAAGGVAAAQAAPSPLANQWPIAGADLSNTRNQPNEHTLGPGNVRGLTVKWSFPTTAGSGVWSTPTVANGVVYAPDSAGFLYAIDAQTAHQLWADHLPDLSPLLPANVFARTSPVVFGDELILGDQHPTTALGTGAHLFAVDRATGKLRWITTVDPHVGVRHQLPGRVRRARLRRSFLG